MEVKDTGYGWLLNMTSYHGHDNERADVDYVCVNHSTLTLQGSSLQSIIDLRDACDQLIASLEPEDEPELFDYVEDGCRKCYPPELGYLVHDVVADPQQNIIIAAFLTLGEALDFCAKREAESTYRQYAVSTREQLGL